MTDSDSVQEELAATPNEEVVEVQEKMLPQSEVNRLIGIQKKRAAEAAVKRYKEEMEAANVNEPQPSPSAPAGMGGMAAPDMDAIYNQVSERFMGELQKQQQAQQQAQQQQEMERIASDYHSKMAQGSELYDDFGEAIKDFNPAAFPNTVYLATMAENTPSLMYELAKNPQKLVTVEALAERDPNQARVMLSRIAKSIQENEAAKKAAENQQVSNPLSRLKPSPVGTDNGEYAIRDYKNASWLKA